MSSDEDMIRRGDALAEVSLGKDWWNAHARIAALPAAAPAVRVKPLVWEAASGDYPRKWQAWCSLMAGYYYADSDDQKRDYETIRAARILAALAAVEAVK